MNGRFPDRADGLRKETLTVVQQHGPTVRTSAVEPLTCIKRGDAAQFVDGSLLRRSGGVSDR